nr:hypothetical protein Cbor_451 [Cedratvirus borely]WIL03516.1 hypothetical protein Cplu_447 [Cedratvirus plubellavi]
MLSKTMSNIMQVETLLQGDYCLRIDLRHVPDITIFIKNKEGIREMDRLLALYEVNAQGLLTPSLEQDCYQQVKYIVNIYTKKLCLEWYESYPVIGPIEFGNIIYSREQMKDLLADILFCNITYVRLQPCIKILHDVK